MLRHALACFGMLCHALSCFAMLCHALSCFVMLCYALSCFVMLCQALSCFVRLCHALTAASGRMLRTPQRDKLSIDDPGDVGCPIDQIFGKISANIDPNLYKIYSKGCFPMYSRPWDVSGIINRTSGINFALEISRNGHTKNGKLIC